MANELYVLNKGVAAPSSFSSAPTTNIQYDASVNPRLQTINLAGTGPSINCYEIYNTSASSLSTTVTSSILNRLYPVNTTIESYLETDMEKPFMNLLKKKFSNFDIIYSVL